MEKEQEKQQEKQQYVQFSKRIAMTVIIFWCVYRAVNLLIAFLRPTACANLNGLLNGVDNVMLASIGFYTGNSVIEKGIKGFCGGKDDEQSGNG